MPKWIGVEFEGRHYRTVSELSKEQGVSYKKLLGLIKENITPEEAITKLKEKEIVKETEKKIEDETPVTIISDGEEIQVEEFISTGYGPKTISIKTPMEAIAKLKENKSIKYINFIDFENLSDKNIELVESYINRKNSLNIFFYNACIYSNDFFKVTKDCNNTNLQVLIYLAEDQLVDHLITYYLGAISTMYPDKYYSILTKDHGFYPFIEALSNPQIRGVGFNYISNKEDRFKLSLCKYISSIKILEHRNCIKSNEFPDLFRNFIRGKATKKELDRLIKQLIEYKFMQKSTKGNLVIYKFDMDCINQIVDRYYI